MINILFVGGSCQEASIRALNEGGHSVIAASDGRQAIDLGAARRPDVLVTDWELRGAIHGVQVLETLRLVDPELPAVVTSATVPVDLGWSLRQLGAAAWLRRPFPPSALTAAVATVLEMAPPDMAVPEIGVFATRLDGRIVNANPRARRLLGQTAAGERATHLPNLLSPIELREADDEWIEVRPRAETPQVWQVRAHHEPGTDRRLVVALAGEQCLAQVEQQHGIYDPEFLVQRLLDLPPTLGSPRWPVAGRALVVDESAMLRREMSVEIERTGTMCYTAPDLVEARRLVASDSEIVTVLVSDALLSDDLLSDDLALSSLSADARPGLCLVTCGDSAPVSTGLHLKRPWRVEDLVAELRGGGSSPRDTRNREVAHRAQTRVQASVPVPGR